MGKGLTIYLSNQLETLIENLAELLIKPDNTDAISPLKSEVIIVQSSGMERWVSQELARINGICANCLFPFPNAFLKELFDHFLPHLSHQAGFEPSVMTFRLMKLLPDYLHLKEFNALNHYLKEDKSALKLFQLSSKIAETFDQYLIFRPEEIFRWEKGQPDKRADHNWQSILWQALIKDTPPYHRARLREEFLKEITHRSDKHRRLKQIYPRITLFAISYLPAFHLKVIEAVSKICSVHLFFMNPSKEYWADIVTDKEKRRIQERVLKRSPLEVDHYFEKGNRLLASLGGLGRNFFAQILEMEGQWVESFKDPFIPKVLKKAPYIKFGSEDGLKAPPHSLLSMLQRDILHLNDRKSKEATQNTVWKGVDSSIEIHSCHSPMREIEVLYDQLFKMFESDPDLFPHDIFVVTPNIDVYAPYIKAVFDNKAKGQPYIPFAISDQSVEREKRGLSEFFTLLKLTGTRLGVSSVVNLFESGLIRKKYDLTEDQVDLIIEWFQKSFIRWGIDGGHRKSFGLTAFSENTWEKGIERLLLGYAMAGYDRRTFHGILPYDDIEGSDTLVLGRITTLIRHLVDVVRMLEKPAPLMVWTKRLRLILKRFFITDDGMPIEFIALNNLIQDLAFKQELSKLDSPLGIDIISAYLKRELEKEHAKKGALYKGITFCSMVPVRSIPSKVICLVGMNHDNFPRMDHTPSFNIILKRPKPDDQSMRLDDKYLFLESILSARNTLYISYVGQSIRDNSKIPPSVVVSELIDYITKGFGISDSDLIFTHKLQGFADDYYQKKSPLSSFSLENFTALKRSYQPKQVQKFFEMPLPEAPSHLRNLTLTHLSDFLTNPSKYLLVSRLRLTFSYEDMPLMDAENFSLTGLNRYLLGQSLVKNALEGQDLDDLYTIEKMRGGLPVGNLGRSAFGEIKNEVITFLKKLEAYTMKETPLKRTSQLKTGPYSIEGSISPIHSGGLILNRFSDTRSVDLIFAFLSHLMFLGLRDKDLPGAAVRYTYLITKDKIWRFDPTPDYEEILRGYLDLYWKGLVEPLPLFKYASFAYAKKRFLNGKSKGEALTAAQKGWEESTFGPGDLNDPYHKLCYKDENPMDERFERVAEAVYDRLFSLVESVK